MISFILGIFVACYQVQGLFVYLPDHMVDDVYSMPMNVVSYEGTDNVEVVFDGYESYDPFARRLENDTGRLGTDTGRLETDTTAPTTGKRAMIQKVSGMPIDGKGSDKGKSDQEVGKMIEGDEDNVPSEVDDYITPDIGIYLGVNVDAGIVLIPYDLPKNVQVEKKRW